MLIMKIDKSSKSGKKDYIQEHHIVPKRIDKSKSNTKTTKLTLNEHATIHRLNKGIDSNDHLMMLFISWMKGIVVVSVLLSFYLFVL